MNGYFPLKLSTIERTAEKITKIQTKINTKIHIGVSNNNEVRCVALGHSNKYKKCNKFKIIARIKGILNTYPHEFTICV